MILPMRPAPLLAFAALAAAVVVPARAADMALRGAYAVTADPAETPAYDWSGASLGVQAEVSGAARRRLNLGSTATALPPSHDLGDVSLRGAGLGLRAGYDVQSPFSPWVAGVAVEMSGDGLRRSLDGVSPQGVGYHAAARADWDAALRLRAGYAFDRLLIYATAGAAVAREKLRLSASSATARTDILASKLFIGATFGLGAEYALTRHLTAGVEYRYTAFGDKTLAGDVYAGAAAAGVAQVKIAPDMHRLAATLNWRY